MSHWGNNQEGPDIGASAATLGHMDEWGEMVVDYLDGTAAQAQQAAMDAHLTDCPTCSARLLEQRETSSLLRSISLAESPEGLADRVLGELFFPSHVIPLPEPPRPTLSSLWHRRLRAWVPAAAAVAAVLVGIVAYGLVNPADDQQVATDLQVSSTIAATQGPATVSAETAATPKSETENESDATATTAAAMAETTTTATGSVASGETGIDPASAGSPPVTVTSRKAMVEALRTSAGPLYIAFTPKPADSESDSGDAGGTDVPADTASTDDSQETSSTTDSGELVTSASGDWVEETVAELREFTELEPLPASLSLSQPVYAAYLDHDHVSAFVDLLLSIAASVRLDVSLQAEADRGWEPAALINEHKDELPVLLSHVLPQPAVVRFSFTTTTLVSEDAGSGSEAVPPDEAGTHCLTILFMRP